MRAKKVSKDPAIARGGDGGVAGRPRPELEIRPYLTVREARKQAFPGGAAIGMAYAHILVEVDMSSEIHGAVGGSGASGDSGRSLSTMNLITVFWLLASGQVAALPNADPEGALDPVVDRTGAGHR
jgi:hypothetical protein